MSTTRGSASYKKQDGTLAFNKAKQSLSWTPVNPPSSPVKLIIAVQDITNLQQTPAGNPKVALKVVVQLPGAPEENHVFSFTSPIAARAEQEAITEALRTVIAAAKAKTAQNAFAKGGGGGGASGQSAAIAIANAVTAGAKAAESWYDDQKLKADVALHRSLLQKDTALRQRFEESLREKPESISNAQFSLQFWSARLHLLRAHAIERSQQQGTYNVLSEVKPRVVDGATKLNLTKEQIQLIFNQHPIVRRVYNDTVPPLSEIDFWSRFFVSRLFKKLKGERIVESDATDKILDKYLNIEEERARQEKVEESHIPHFIDLEGNEQNHSQRKGNQPDVTMRPTAHEGLQALNRLSEQILSHVAPVDGEPHAPIGLTENTFQELRLRDLEAEAAEDRVVLKIQDQRALLGGDGKEQISAEARLYAKQDPAQVLRTLREDLSSAHLDDLSTPGSGLNLSSAIGINEASSDSESDAEGTTKSNSSSNPKPPRTGSHAALASASAQLFSLITQQRSRISPPTSASGTSLSPHTLQSLLLAHNTTTEFLHYFWTLFLAPSSSPSAERDLPSLLTTLAKSLARISAVAADAEKERQAQIVDLKRQAAEFQQRTGKRRRVDESMVTVGGRTEVERLMAPTVRAIGVARERYEAAVRAKAAGVS